MFGLRKKCPDARALQQFAAHPDSPDIAEHLIRCATCRAVVEGLAPSDALLAALRAATRAEEADASIERISEICGRVAGEVLAPPAPRPADEAVSNDAAQTDTAAG